jgi:hypothetical protein
MTPDPLYETQKNGIARPYDLRLPSTLTLKDESAGRIPYPSRPIFSGDLRLKEAKGR